MRLKVFCVYGVRDKSVIVLYNSTRSHTLVDYLLTYVHIGSLYDRVTKLDPERAMVDLQVMMLSSGKGKVPPGTVCAGVNVNGENVYIGQYAATSQERHWNEMPLLVYGVITPSQGVITYCHYNSSEKELLTLNTSKEYQTLTGRDSTVFYWLSSEGYTENDTNYFPEGAVVTDPIGRKDKPFLLFVARVEAPAIKESKVVGYYDKSKFPADFDGPLVGVGQAWYDEGIRRHVHQTPIKYFKVHVPFDGKIFEVYKFQFLCSCRLPKLFHITYSTINWVTVSDGHLPPNAITAGVAPNGEVLYVGRREHARDLIPGYIVPSEKCLHICYGCNEHCYNSDYEALTIEDQDSFEWGVYSNGEVPSNALIGNKRRDGLYVGRTVTGSDISTATTWQKVPINLPHERVANTQLLGKIHCSHRCLYVPWDGKEILYQSYEVLMLKMRPKSLKGLCFNAIITATMGVSDRIDQLPLPMKMRNVLKEICQLL
ncbi:uncharacterized protein [Dysidea avara]|uniref:uncharacterized protein isoform X2 n=1 Tax=Dysidea avara TaxID=196820 RepID=UPI003316B1AF